MGDAGQGPGLWGWELSSPRPSSTPVPLGTQGPGWPHIPTVVGLSPNWRTQGHPLLPPQLKQKQGPELWHPQQNQPEAQMPTGQVDLLQHQVVRPGSAARRPPHPEGKTLAWPRCFLGQPPPDPGWEPAHHHLPA